MPAHPPDTGRSETDQYRTEIEKLFVEFEAQVYRCVHRDLPRPAAEEIVDSAFLALVPHWDGIREDRSPIRYVLRTAFNLRADARRRAAAARWDNPKESRPEPGRPDGLGAALTRLSPREEQVTVMRYWMDLAPDEIAQILGSSDHQVSKMIMDGRTRLAELLSPSLPAAVPDGDHDD